MHGCEKCNGELTINRMRNNRGYDIYFALSEDVRRDGGLPRYTLRLSTIINYFWHWKRTKQIVFITCSFDGGELKICEFPSVVFFGLVPQTNLNLYNNYYSSLKAYNTTSFCNTCP